jgi:hypothetical protein
VPKKPPSRDKAKELFWRKAVQRQLESGLSQAAFCEKEGLNPNSFSGWKKEVARRDVEAASQSSVPAKDIFVPVTSLPEATADAKGRPIAEIDLASGVVRIFAGIDRHALHEVIAALREVTR